MFSEIFDSTKRGLEMAVLAAAPLLGSPESDEVIVRGACEVPTLGGRLFLNRVKAFVIHVDSGKLKHDYRVGFYRGNGSVVKEEFGYEGNRFRNDAILGNNPANNPIIIRVTGNINGRWETLQTGVLRDPCRS